MCEERKRRLANVKFGDTVNSKDESNVTIQDYNEVKITTSGARVKPREEEMQPTARNSMAPFLTPAWVDYRSLGNCKVLVVMAAAQNAT